MTTTTRKKVVRLFGCDVSPQKLLLCFSFCSPDPSWRVAYEPRAPCEPCTTRPSPLRISLFHSRRCPPSTPSSVVANFAIPRLQPRRSRPFPVYTMFFRVRVRTCSHHNGNAQRPNRTHLRPVVNLRALCLAKAHECRLCGYRTTARGGGRRGRRRGGFRRATPRDEEGGRLAEVRTASIRRERRRRRGRPLPKGGVVRGARPRGPGRRHSRAAEWIVARARGGDHAATAFGRAAAVAIADRRR